MHPTTAAFASLTLPSKHDAKSEHYAERRQPSIHAAFSLVDPQNHPHESVKTLLKKAAAYFAKESM
jgi:hypothetical protein